MKKKYITLVMVFTLIGSVLGVSSFDLFKRGNKLYEKGKYSEALNIYNDLLKENADWKLFFNIGNCYFRTGDYVKAKIFYLKAKKMNLTDKDIDKNIKIVNTKFKDKIPKRKNEFFKEAINKIESLLSLNFLTILLMFFVFIFNIFLFIRIRKRGEINKKIYAYLLSTLFILMIINGVYLKYRINKMKRHQIGVVLKDETILRSGKDSKNNTNKINSGLDVKILEDEGEWLKVIVSEDIEGWLKRDEIEII